MADIHSSLLNCYRPGIYGSVDSNSRIIIEELPVPSLFQVAGWPDSFTNEAESLAAEIDLPVPENFRTSATREDTTVFAVAPETWLCISETPFLLERAQENTHGDHLFLADLSHSRTRIRLTGHHTATLLMRDMGIDFSDIAFPESHFVQSSLHGISVLVHRLENVSENDSEEAAFDLLIQRTFSVSFWDWLTNHAAGFGYEVR